MTARIFAVLAAIFLVVSIGIAALTPLGLTLAQWLLSLNATAVDWAHTHSPAWVWTWIELPFLLRPLWLLPACLGVIAGGLALSLNLGRASPSRRRRS